MKRIRIFGTLLVGILMSAGFAFPSVAFASDLPPCDGMDTSSGTGTCADVVQGESYSASSSESHVVAINGVDVHSTVTVLARIQAKGATPQQMQGKHHRLSRAMCMNTSYNAYYQGNPIGERWKVKCYAKGKLFVKGSDGYWHDPKCWNKVVGIPHGKKHVGRKVYGQVKLVVAISFDSSASAVLNEKVASLAKAWCTTSNTYAYGEGSASAAAYAAASARLSGSVKVSVLAAVRAQANSNLNAQLGGMSVVDIRAQLTAVAFAQAETKASAKAVCTEAQQVTPPPTFAQFNQFNDLEVNWVSDHCVTVDFPNGDSGTVFWTAHYGSFAVPQKVASDMVQVCSTYKAPGEVPAGGTDTITVTATDSTTGKSVTQTTDPFVIHPTAPPPLRVAG